MTSVADELINVLGVFGCIASNIYFVCVLLELIVNYLNEYPNIICIYARRIYKDCAIFHRASEEYLYSIALHFVYIGMTVLIFFLNLLFTFIVFLLLLYCTLFLMAPAREVL